MNQLGHERSRRAKGRKMIPRSQNYIMVLFSFHLQLYVRITKIPSLRFTFKHIVFPLGSHLKSLYCQAFTLVHAEKVKEQSHF